MDMSNAAAVVERVGRWTANRLLGTRRWTDAAAAELAAGSRGLRVLEIGSGRQDLGADAYSLKQLFPQAGEFVQSDVNPAFGHRVVDITEMALDQEFDLILCMNVLEHVFDVQRAVDNLRKALRPGGKLLIAVPFVYPYHDEPIDFWRITEHSLRALCRDYSAVEVRHKGPRRFPKGLLAVATR
jgi:SAM-dependent methyltransferase